MSANLFLSYAHKDDDFVAKLRQSLARVGLQATGFDPAPGSDWEDGLRSALEQSDAIIAVLTPASLDSAIVMQELGAAMMLDKPLVLVDPGLKPLPATRMTRRDILQGQGMTTDQIAAKIQQRLAA